ncbi:hypothetical protein [Chryseobacterium koreense]
MLFKKCYFFLRTLLYLSIFLFASSCRTKSPDYIVYYNQVNDTDSILRIKKDTLTALKSYRKIFKKYAPHQTDWINEFETYIVLSDKFQKNFGGKKSLNKLIPLIAPYWKYRKDDKELLNLFQKYGIDSNAIAKERIKWERNLNKVLIDSFSIAMKRDQENHRMNSEIQAINDQKNFKLLLWTFENYGYPTEDKIGVWNKEGLFLKPSIIIHHMAGYEEPFFILKKKLPEFIKKGDLSPADYASMIDRDNNLNMRESEYNFEYMFSQKPLNNKIDSNAINKNRRKIGLPSIKHHQIILKDATR